MDNYEEVERLATVARQTTSSAEKGLGSSLCNRCTASTIFRRDDQMGVTVFCQNMRRDVPANIVECSGFNGIRQMSLFDMQQIALPIDGRTGINEKSYL